MSASTLPCTPVKVKIVNPSPHLSKGAFSRDQPSPMQCETPGPLLLVPKLVTPEPSNEINILTKSVLKLRITKPPSQSLISTNHLMFNVESTQSPISAPTPSSAPPQSTEDTAVSTPRIKLCIRGGSTIQSPMSTNITNPSQPTDDPSSLPLLPPVKDRVMGTWYLYQDVRVVFWDGKYLKCQHKRHMSLCKECGGSQICEHNQIRGRCKECGGSQICGHNRRREICKDCKGSSMCEHNRQRAGCKECKGRSICQHNRARSTCRDCGGSEICEHNRQRSRCKDCGGSQICVHNRARSVCKDCGGSQICEHNRHRSRCKDCKGSQICEHKRERRYCKDCKGYGICVHNRVRSKCKECGGGHICEHDRKRSNCKECGESQICEHKINRANCKTCFTHPQNFCRICTNISVHKGSRMYPLCLRCHVLTYPGEKIPSRFKMKEHHILDHLCSYCPDYNFIHDQIIAGGCSKRKPDLRLECLTHSIVIEIDENQHEDYKCEEKRLMQIFEDLGNRPLVVLRFNPDAYIDAGGVNVPGLFTFGTDNLIVEKDSEQVKQRVYTLSQRIRYHVENIPTKEVTIEKLYYNYNLDSRTA